ncbi:conserved hypothetical protein [Uncinocarpus reesii 1704]|uniref:U6 small nuclear RNA (adenine-(43)-N(6))-methyltransferase n=1 Tax=Uncinocarpus reesii (strain UAMH 1704) TaxID=336963 RepID=C4JX82_UNCRE|nr:uncharacterized protein UREG_06255 [Uncinocarpus reesii 1704]EEP81390.1 conserved hypothetical protein [Uncinocarpus reesii 1704]
MRGQMEIVTLTPETPSLMPVVSVMNPTTNIYQQGVDFRALALEDPDFAKFLKINGQLNFNDPDAVRYAFVPFWPPTSPYLALNEMSELSDGRAIDEELIEKRFQAEPGVTGQSTMSACTRSPHATCFMRDELVYGESKFWLMNAVSVLAYILWLQELIDTTNGSYCDQNDPEREVVGLDILDIDDDNIKIAQENVKRNDLQSRIHVVRTTQADFLIPLGDKIPFETEYQAKIVRLQFTMCNPPFYESEEEMMASANLKHRPPNSACTGAPVEMVTTGGEERFVSRMIEESVKLRTNVQWYSSMLGKLSSVTTLVEKLQEAGNQNWAVTEFVPGSKTRRWAIAWSWQDLRPPMDAARNIPSIPKHLLPFPSEFSFQPKFESITFLIRRINNEMQALRMVWRWNQHSCKGLGFATENVWSRQARRKQQHFMSRIENAADSSPPIDESKAALGVLIHVRQTGIENVDVIVRWVKGFDHVLFESFCGMFKRKIE